MPKNSPTQPATPDPYAVSAAQTGSNVNTAVANSVLGNANTYDPYGSTTFQQIGNTQVGDQSVPQWSKTTTLAPDQQKILDLTNATKIGLGNLALDSTGRMAGVLSNPVTAEGLPGLAGTPQAPSFNGLQNGPQYSVAQLHGMGGAPLPIQGNIQTGQQSTSFNPGGPIQSNVVQGPYATDFGQTSGNIVNSVGPQDFSADRQAVTDSLLSRINPQIDRDRNALENQLVNQGFVRGTTAFDSQMDQVNRQANDQRTQAVLAGGQEQSRLAGLQLQQGQFANQAQAQDYGQQQGRGMFGQQATGLNNQANLNAGNFANSSQAQLFGQNQAQGNFGNAAVGANNATALASGSFVNSAAGQAFAQQQAKQAFDNAVAQGNAQGANDAANQVYQNAVQQTQYGNTNAQQGFSNNMSTAQLNNQTRAQGIQERMGLASFPINQTTALMSGSQVSMPQAVQYQGGTIQPTNVSGNVYNSAALAQQNYATQMAQQNAAMGGMFGLGSAALLGGMNGGSGGFGNSAIGQGLSALNPIGSMTLGMFSDRRLKRDIIDTGIRLMNGLKLYSFKYVWDAVERIGVMADETKKIIPQAVFNVGGYDAVNYDMAMESA